MRPSLKLHPGSQCPAVTHIDVNVTRPRPGTLIFQYLLSGKTCDLRLPPVTSPTRADELWRHTCFEAFVRASPGTAYYEFNFSPSTQWAAYGFSSYRSGMHIAGIDAPRIVVRANGEHFELDAALELDRLPGLPSNTPWHLGLSAVIEEVSGRKSWWALAHPRGKPDFHHSDCFVHELPAALPS